MLNVVFLDAAAFPENYEIRKPNFPHNWIVYDRTSPDQTFERCKEADIVITSKVVFDRELLQKLGKIGRLKLIQITATGTNNVDLEAARDQQITVQNVAGYSSNSVAEHVIACIFAMAKSMHAWSRDQLAAVWTQQDAFTYFAYPMYDVKGKTLTIIGKGQIGTEVAQKAEALGMKVLFAERAGASELRSGYTEFREAVRQADFISLHCPLTVATEKMVNQAFLKLLKPNCFIINTGRGGLIDEQVLAEALIERRIGGAALDVLSIEPPTMDNPLVRAALDLPNLYITPHQAFASESSLRTLADLVIDYVNDFVARNYRRA